MTSTLIILVVIAALIFWGISIWGRPAGFSRASSSGPLKCITGISARYELSSGTSEPLLNSSSCQG